METSTYQSTATAFQRGQLCTKTSSTTRESIKMCILSILEANLIHNPPQPVATQHFTQLTGCPGKTIDEVLRLLDDSGLVQTDIDVQCSIITFKGLQWIRSFGRHAAIPRSSTWPDRDADMPS